MTSRRTVSMLGAVLVGAGLVAVTAPAQAASTWTNCTSVHKKYPHGVGTRTAHDRTSGTPVTSFKRSDALYKTAMSHNKGLDRDKDKVACEAP